MQTLPEALQDFQIKFNSNAQLKKLLLNWNPNIILNSIDSGNQYTLWVREQLLANILEKEEPSDHQIFIEAENETLVKVFSGTLNPSEAVLDGDMVVFGDDKDQIKLDAITLIIWGM